MVGVRYMCRVEGAARRINAFAEVVDTRAAGPCLARIAIVRHGAGVSPSRRRSCPATCRLAALTCLIRENAILSEL